MTTGSFSFLPRLTRPCWRGPLLGTLTTLIGSGLPAGRPLEAQSPAPQVPSIQVPGIPNAPDLVTVVPFYTKPDETKDEQMKIVIPVEVDGHRSNVLLDTGGEYLCLLNDYWRPSPTGGVDTNTANSGYPPHGKEVSSNDGDRADAIHVTLRIGTLVDTFVNQMLRGPNPHHLNAYVGCPPMSHDWLKAFLDYFTPVSGNLGPRALESFETIIDYTHRRLVLIRLDKAGHRLVSVPAYTPKRSVSLIFLGPKDSAGLALAPIPADTTTLPHNRLFRLPELYGTVDTLDIWKTRRIGIAARPDGILDTLDASKNTVVYMTDTGAWDNVLDYPNQYGARILGYPFLSALGIVGFNQWTHQFILYR